MKSNLAFALQPVEQLEPSALDAVELDTLLRLGSGRIGARLVGSAARGRRMLASFQDNHSAICRPFRIY
jgi:hypothetical protein